MAKTIRVWDGSAWIDVAVSMPDVSGYASTNSPSLTGTPTAPTAAPGTDSTQIATTEFVQDAIAGFAGEEVYYSANAPATPQIGDLWIEEDVDLSTSTYHTAYAADAPSANFLGDLWVESDVDIDTYSPSIISRWSKEVSSATTTFSGISDSKLLSYTVGYECVYLNGVLLNRGSDYTANDGSTITLTVAAEAGDILEVIGVNATTVLNTYTQAQIDALISPKSNTNSPTFTGIPAAPTAAVDTNTNQIATTAYVVGQGYAKSSELNSTYALLSGSNFTGNVNVSGNLGLGITSPSTKLEVDGVIKTRATGGEGGEIQFNNPDNGSVGLYIDVSSSNNGRIYQIQNNCALQIGQLIGTGGSVVFYTNGSERMNIDPFGRVKFPSGSIIEAPVSINDQTGTAYTLAITDAGRLVEMNNASANVVTIPAENTVNFPIGTKIDIVQTGAGETSIAPFDGSVTLVSDTNKRKINVRYAAVSLVKRASNSWILIGALKA